MPGTTAAAQATVSGATSCGHEAAEAATAAVGSPAATTAAAVLPPPPVPALAPTSQPQAPASSASPSSSGAAEPDAAAHVRAAGAGDAPHGSDLARPSKAKQLASPRYVRLMVPCEAGEDEHEDPREGEGEGPGGALASMSGAADRAADTGLVRPHPRSSTDTAVSVGTRAGAHVHVGPDGKVVN